MTQSELKSLLHYDQDTGIFTWLNSISKIKEKSIAGYLHPLGYVDIQINKKHYKAHRLAWLYIYGKWPKQFIDHINNNKSDNRLLNLREATSVQNKWNTPSTSSTGAKGVYWIASRNRYRVSFTINGKLKCFGHFKKEHFKEAKELAKTIILELHGEYANLD